MSVNIRQHPRGGWDVDISVLLTTGDRYRERRKLNASYSNPSGGSNSAAFARLP